jgi:4-coumarate--CoA ligase
MPIKSKWPDLDIPKCNILSYLFPKDKPVSEKPLWIDAGDPSNSLSAVQMLLWVKRLAVGLDKLGVKQAQAVMVFTPNHIFVPLVYLAAAGSGRFYSGANPSYTANELAHQMKSIEATVVLIHPTLLMTGIEGARLAGISKDRLFQFTDSECETVHGVRDWRSIVASVQEAESWQWDELGEKSLTTVATINFSSGTTGLPKGVCITHHNLISNTAQGIFNRLATTKFSIEQPPPARWLAMLPLYHAYSQLYTINIALKLRGVEVYVMRSFVLKDYLSCIQTYKINELQTVPPVIVMLAKRPEVANYDLSSVEQILCGAAPLKSDLQNQVSTRFNLVIVQGWGMTELTCGGIGIPGREKDETGSIGYLMPNTEAMLIDEDGNEVTKEGEPGELWVRGPQVLLSYWRNEQATEESKTDDGWFKTGDVAVCKNDKFWIVDRKKELIKVNGLQVAPAELEALLLGHEHIADAAVVGINLHNDEWPRAYIVLQEKGKMTEKDVQKWFEGQVAKHKRLVGGVMFVDEVPKLASGKIMRKVMKEWAKRDAKEMEGKVKARL